jgi:RNA polymerase sigma factor (sigma-70 family)
MNDATSEAQLLQASAGGSKDAFGAIVRRYQALVCAITYSATGDPGTSEELAQETFIRAWRNLRQLEDPGKFRVWLCTIARNLANTWLRARRRGAVHTLESAAGLSATEPGPDDAASAKERQEMVWAAVERVPLQYREPLVLFYCCQQSVSEVAADLDLSNDAVRQRLHRGRQLIKAEVASLVEETLARSGPGKAFAVAVVGALPALVTPPASAAVVGAAAKAAPPARALVGTGLTGAILGPILGLPGGFFGAWWSSKFNGSPRERRLMIRIAIAWWLLFFALIALPLTLVLAGLTPMWALGLSLAVFFILQLALILWSITGPRRIQIEELTYNRRERWPARVPRPGLYGSFGGAIGGASLPWLHQAWRARDWVSFGAILTCAILVFFVVTEVWMRKLQR